MSRTKGTPKTGGRTTGTPNKVTSTLKEFIKGIINNNRDQIEKDLKALQPKERLMILERLMQYIVPKQSEEVQEIPKSVKIEIASGAKTTFATSEDEIDTDLPERFK